MKAFIAIIVASMTLSGCGIGPKYNMSVEVADKNKQAVKIINGKKTIVSKSKQGVFLLVQSRSEKSEPSYIPLVVTIVNRSKTGFLASYASFYAQFIDKTSGKNIISKSLSPDQFKVLVGNDNLGFGTAMLMVGTIAETLAGGDATAGTEQLDNNFNESDRTSAHLTKQQFEEIWLSPGEKQSGEIYIRAPETKNFSSGELELVMELALEEEIIRQKVVIKLTQ
jgi:hypothetical protein